MTSKNLQNTGISVFQNLTQNAQRMSVHHTKDAELEKINLKKKEPSEKRSAFSMSSFEKSNKEMGACSGIVEKANTLSNTRQTRVADCQRRASLKNFESSCKGDELIGSKFFEDSTEVYSYGKFLDDEDSNYMRKSVSAICKAFDKKAEDSRNLPVRYTTTVARSRDKDTRSTKQIFETKMEDLPSKYPTDLGSALRNGFTCSVDNCDCTQARWTQSVPDDSDALENSSLWRTRRSHSGESRDDALSERSCYSTDSSEEANGYELVDWQSDWDKDIEIKKPQEVAECYETPPSSPRLDLGALNGFHTAPNSPDTEDGGFCIVTKQNGHDGSESETASLAFMSPTESTQSFVDVSAPHNGGQSNNAITNRNGSNDVSTFDVLPMAHRSELVDNEKHILKMKDGNNTYSKQRNTHSNTVRQLLNLETPPFIDIHAIQYEADPTTGKVRSVGKGSFGQVFKARFFDPRFHHLPIVVKEFDEEFTSNNEIIEEAQRLLYLRDTGYVPVCYGLVKLGTSENPTYGIVQEYIGTGLTLEQILWDQYEMPVEMWLSIAAQSCEGLDSFHQKGILLNDIKSNNIILEFSQESVNIKYIDFGLATGMRGKRYKNTKSLEEFVYLAPEVRSHGHVTTIASDIYSLGYMLQQINKFAGVPEIKFVSSLCMKYEPAERTSGRIAASLLRNHMAILGCDTRFTSGVDNLQTTGYW